MSSFENLESLIADAYNSLSLIDLAISKGWEFSPALAEIIADEIGALHDAGEHKLAHGLDSRFVDYCGLAND